MVYVVTVSRRLAAAATIDELSRPPLSSNATGTSARNRSSTARKSVFRSRSAASSSERSRDVKRVVG
jgi:hypothetical protein